MHLPSRARTSALTARQFLGSVCFRVLLPRLHAGRAWAPHLLPSVAGLGQPGTEQMRDDITVRR
jgi:hypothetical protein